MSQRPRVLIELGAELDRAARAPAARRRPQIAPGALSAWIAVAAAVAVAAFAVLALGHRHRSTPTPVAPAGHTPHLRSLEASFAALRRPRTPVDRIPTHYRALTLPGHPTGLQFDRSRRVVSTAHEQIWLVPARHDLCTFEIHSGPRIPRNLPFVMGCTTAAGAEQEGLVAWSATAFVAILPDGTGPVRLALRDGDVISATPNDEGVVEQPLRAALRGYAFTTPDGKRFVNRITP